MQYCGLGAQLCLGYALMPRRRVFGLSQPVESKPNLPHRHIEENYDKSMAVEREFVPPAHLCPRLGKQPFLATHALALLRETPSNLGFAACMDMAANTL